MRIPHLVVMQRQSVAALTVSFGRIWQTIDVGDLILGYNACGRLARVVFLDPRRSLPIAPQPADAVRAALSALTRDAHSRADDLEVLRSALRRATVHGVEAVADAADRTG